MAQRMLFEWLEYLCNGATEYVSGHEPFSQRLFMKNYSTLAFIFFSVLLSTACAAAPGPPTAFGLGPWLDQLVPVLLIPVLAFLAWKYGPALLKKTDITISSDREVGRAHSILRQRYARGEITRDQYLQMLDDLESRL
jgi:Short C-terminal domain